MSCFGGFVYVARVLLFSAIALLVDAAVVVEGGKSRFFSC